MVIRFFFKWRIADFSKSEIFLVSFEQTLEISQLIENYHQDTFLHDFCHERKLLLQESDFWNL